MAQREGPDRLNATTFRSRRPCAAVRCALSRWGAVGWRVSGEARSGRRGAAGERRLPVADKWLTFDCYGTVADWNACMGGALEAVAGKDAGGLLTAYHQAEFELEALPDWRRYREVLTAGLARAAEREHVTLPGDGQEAVVRAWPDMPVFADAGPALAALLEQGWRLAFLPNCDDA